MVARAAWYRRNVRIYNNVAKLITSPDDRILVIGVSALGLIPPQRLPQPRRNRRRHDALAFLPHDDHLLIPARHQLLGLAFDPEVLKVQIDPILRCPRQAHAHRDLIEREQLAKIFT